MVGPPVIVVCGEALIDLVPRPDGAWEARPGGAPANVAVTLARLGTPAAFLGGLSSDSFGRRLRAHLDDAGVDVSRCPPVGAPTALAVADITHAEVTYAFYVAGTATFAAVDRSGITAGAAAGPVPRAVYVGGLGTLIEPMAASLGALLDAAGPAVVRMYDPNVRPSAVAGIDGYLRQVEGWVARSDIVKASEGDLAYLYPGEPAGEVAAHWVGLGASLVTVTRGAEGSEGYSSTVRAQVAATPVDAGDAIGAGDAFSAGLLHSLWSAGSLERAALAGLTADAMSGHLRAAGGVAADHLRGGQPSEPATAAVPGDEPRRLR